MDQTLQKISDDLKNTLTEISSINKARKEYEEKNGGELATLKGSLAKAIEDFDVKFQKGEDLQKQLETSFIKLANTPDAPESREELKSYNKLLKSFKRPELNKEGFAEVSKAIDKYIRFGSVPCTDVEMKALNTVLDPQGGFFVIPQRASEIVTQAIELHGIMGVITRMPASTSPVKVTADWSQWADAAYKNELTATPTPTTPTPFREVSIPVTTQLYGMPFSRELLEDSYTDIQSHVIGRMGEGMDDQTGTYVVLGDGADKPRGFLTYTAGTGFGQIEQITSTLSGHIVWDDVMTILPKSIKPIYNNSSISSFVMNKSTFYDLIGDKDGSSRFQIANQINFFSGQGISLGIMGNPVVWEPSVPIPAANSLSVAFGNFRKAYTFVERVGKSIHRNESDPAFLTLTLRRRNGGGIVNSEAIKILKIKA